MPRHDPRHSQVVQWLTEQGHTDDQIDHILQKLRVYDEQTLHESIFDSIESGTIDIAAIVNEVLGSE